MPSKLGTKKSRFKIQRALQVELPGLGKPGALERRAYPPGQHGHARRKLSEYSIQLREKQKLKFHYGLREEQLKRLVTRAKKARLSPNGGTWMDRLVQDLELRLDNVVFRLGFARSIPAARQLVRHGKVLVNGKRRSISSEVLRVKDVVTLAPECLENASVMHSRQNPRMPLPNYLSLDANAGVISSRPLGGDIPFDFAGRIVTEFFSKS